MASKVGECLGRGHADESELEGSMHAENVTRKPRMDVGLGLGSYGQADGMIRRHWLQEDGTSKIANGGADGAALSHERERRGLVGYHLSEGVALSWFLSYPEEALSQK